MTAGIQTRDRFLFTTTPASPPDRTGRLLQRGRMVAFVGADGCGKTTVTREITHWISAAFDAMWLYFGSGKGTISTPRQALEAVAALSRAASRLRASPSSRAGPPLPVVFHRGAGQSTIRDWGDMLWVLALSRERRARIRQAERARGQGTIVICDRFPQSLFPGLNDGPWLSHWLDHPSSIRRFAARDEQAAFRLAERHPPDLVVKLHVPLATALARRPDVPRRQLEEKMRQLQRLSYPGAPRMVDIDAAQPLDQVLLDAKQALWSAL